MQKPTNTLTPLTEKMSVKYKINNGKRRPRNDMPSE
jgi:hypothetical protein